MKDIKMEGVREYAEEMSVELGTHKNQRLIIKAYNEAGYNSTKVDLQDVVDWIRKNKPELLKI